jgi:nucleotide-binding universal stress UspA family protein
MFPTKILLATDRSEEARRAARMATTLSENLGSELHLVRVEAIPSALADPESVSYGTGYWKQVREIARRDVTEKLGEEVQKIRVMGGEVAESYARVGRPDAEIARLAEEIGAGFVVVGSRGLGPVARVVMGSVSEAVVHHAQCPVLVLRGTGDSWPPERIVFGDDGSDAARAAGDLAAALCGRNGARGLVVHAYPRLPEMDAEGRGFNPRTVDDELRLAEKALMQRAGELEGSLGSHPKPRQVVGDAAGCLLEAAREDAPERTLLALGSRGLGAIGRMRLGSVSTKVLHAAEGPVLVCPPPRKEA